MQNKVKITRAGGYDPARGSAHPDNQDPTLEPYATELEMLRRFALAAVFTSPTKPSGIHPRDKARAIEALIERGLLGPHEAGPNRPTSEGFDVLIACIKVQVADAFAALRKANTKVQKCTKPQSLEAASREAAEADRVYRAIAAERDLIVKARAKVLAS